MLTYSMFTSRPALQNATVRTLCALAKNTTLCFVTLTHSSQFCFSPNSREINRSRTLCEKHPGVGVPSFLFSPRVSGAGRSLTRSSAADSIESLAPQHYFAVPDPSHDGGPL